MVCTIYVSSFTIKARRGPISNKNACDTATVITNFTHLKKHFLLYQ